MKTYDIFIDFECISGIFARKINKQNSQIPLSYTIGYRNEKNKTVTLFDIFNFQKYNFQKNNGLINLILDDFEKSIIKNISKITDSKFEIKLEQINFIGWNPKLEQKLLTSIFRQNIDVSSLIEVCKEEFVGGIKGEISLSKVTKNGYNSITYFPEFKKQIKNVLLPEEITRLNLNHNGAIASYAGFVIYNLTFKTRKTKYHIYLDLKTLISELEEYALDDINRMYYFLDNLPEAKKIIRNTKIITDLKKEINKNNKLLELLISLNPNLRAKDIIKKLEKQNQDSLKKISLFEK